LEATGGAVDDVLGYAGRRVIVTGAASGVGLAVAGLLVELGAEVHTVDLRRPELAGIASYSETDLRDPRRIDATVARIGGVLNGLFNCAEPPSDLPALDVVLVGFCGPRHLTEAVVPLMVEGAAIASVASVAGTGWLARAATVLELVRTPDFEAARTWCEAEPVRITDADGIADEAINAYTADRCVDLAERGLRINCLNRGPTDAPPPHAATHEAQAWPLIFLNSPRASHVTGTALSADGGLTGALATGRVEVSLPAPRAAR
jgi:NAD(P)-dependent dehydrogenase (short-subunit alcohol dehydrogenase family)